MKTDEQLEHDSKALRRLELAAPDLLAALKTIAAWDSHGVKLSVDFGSNGVRDHYINIARAAIAKAEKQ